MIKSKKTILLTGSSGLIGFPLVQKLLDLDFKVIGLDPKQLIKENSDYLHLSKVLLSI